MRFLTALTGGLLGASSGLLLVFVVGLFEGGPGGIPFFGLAGSLLVAVVTVVGSVLGRRVHDRFAHHRLGIAVAWLLAPLIVVGLLVAISPASLGGLVFLLPIVIGLLVGLPLSASESDHDRKTSSGVGQRLVTTLVGGLMGLIPILLFLTVARIFGLDESSPVMYFVPSLILLGGIITGAAIGWKMHHRFSGHPLALGATGLATVLVVVGWQLALIASGEESFDPIVEARSCREVYELLGAIESPAAIDEVGDVEELLDSAEIVGLPDDLSPIEIDRLARRVSELEEQSPNDPVCDRLREELEALQ